MFIMFRSGLRRDLVARQDAVIIANSRNQNWQLLRPALPLLHTAPGNTMYESVLPDILANSENQRQILQI